MSRIIYGKNLRKNLSGSSKIANWRPGFKTFACLAAINACLCAGAYMSLSKGAGRLPLVASAKAQTLGEAARRPAEPRGAEQTSFAASFSERSENAKVASVAQFIRSKYKIAPEAASLIVESCYKSARSHDVDPLILLAIIGVESAFNPIAESSVGAKGLSQSLPSAHPEKINGLLNNEQNHILNIADNIELGARIYSEYSRKFNGNATKALQQYNGNLNDPAAAYARKVLALRSRLASVL